jgi:hypothetical protein
MNFVARFLQPIKAARYWARSRFHPKYRHHVIKTGLRPGYYDEDVLILYACMALLKRFVEWHGGVQKLDAFTKELQEETRDGWRMDHQITSQAEASAIYRWWWQASSKREKWMVGGLPSEEEVAMVDDEQKMLRRLIEIRPLLWE